MTSWEFYGFALHWRIWQFYRRDVEDAVPYKPSFKRKKLPTETRWEFGLMITYFFGLRIRFRILLGLKITLNTCIPGIMRWTFSSCIASAMTVS